MSGTVRSQPAQPGNNKGTRKGGQRRRNEALIERDIAMYKRHMRGLSYRAIGEEFDLKGPRAVQIACARGKEHCKARGIDVEETRITIQELFAETLGAAVEQLRDQQQHGVQTFFVAEDGTKSMRRVKGVDVRLIGEITRSAMRWAEFAGIADRAPEQNVHATTVVLGAPSAGADFESRYGGKAIEPGADGQVIDAVPVKSEVISEGGPGWGDAPKAAPVDPEP